MKRDQKEFFLKITSVHLNYDCKKVFMPFFKYNEKRLITFKIIILGSFSIHVFTSYPKDINLRC